MKVKLLIFGFIYIFLISWITLSLGLTYSHDGNDIRVPGVDPTFDISFLTGILTTFWSLVTFQVSGMPYIINITFLIISMILLYVVFSDIIVPIIQANHWVVLGISVLIGLIALVTSFIDLLEPLLEFFEGFLGSDAWWKFWRW